MSTPNEDKSLRALEIEIEAELAAAESGPPLDASNTPVTEWLSDPMDDERYEVGLHGLLDAVKAVEDTTFPQSGTPFSGSGHMPSDL